MPERYDAGGEFRADALEELPNGHIRIPAVIATCRVDAYYRGGRKVLEARPPEELFAPETMRSFEGVVLSRPPHPRPAPGERWAVNSRNTRQHQVGHTLTCRRDGNDLVTDIVVTDAKAIAEIRAGKSKLSPGYGVTFDATPTELDGTRADGTQREIRGNHLVYLPPGGNRQGDAVGFRLDAHDGISVDFEPELSMDEMTIKKTEYDQLRADAAELVALKASRDDSAQRARVDSLEAENAELKAKIEDSTRIDARVELVSSAKHVLGSEYRADGKSDDDVRSAIVLAVQPALKDRVESNREDSGYLRALTDQALAIHAESKNKGAKLLDAAKSAGSRSREDSGESVLAKARREEAEARSKRAEE